MDTLIDVFCKVDDFCQSFLPTFYKKLIGNGDKHRNRQGKLLESEIMTLLIHFHQSRYRDFKHYYIDYVQVQLASYFPNLPCYARFVSNMSGVLIPLVCYLEIRKGKMTVLSQKFRMSEVIPFFRRDYAAS